MKRVDPDDLGNDGDASRIKLVPFDEIKLGTARRYLIKNLIPRVGITVVWGEPKSGKSFWTFDALMHVALGLEYRGRRVHQGTVIYCAFEGQTGIEARVAAFRQRFLADRQEPVPFYLQPITLDLVKDHKELIAAIKAQLGDTKPVAVALDTLNRSLRGSESSDEDMSAYIQAADAIREAFDCAVVIVHHCGIDGKRPRGHSSLTGAVDAQLAVWRDPADNIVTEVEFAKDGPQGDKLFSKLEVVSVGIDEDGETITSCVVKESAAFAHSAAAGPRLSQNQQTMFAILREYGPLTTEQWNEKARAAGIGGRRKATLCDIQMALRGKGLVHQPTPGLWAVELWPTAEAPSRGSPSNHGG